jgi:hypothetical protein
MKLPTSGHSASIARARASNAARSSHIGSPCSPPRLRSRLEGSCARERWLPSAGRQALARTPAPRKVGQPILRGQSPSGATVMSGAIEIEVAPSEE